MSITACPMCLGDGVVDTDAHDAYCRDAHIIDELRAELARVNAQLLDERARTQAVLDALGPRAGERVDHAAQRVAGELREAREERSELLDEIECAHRVSLKHVDWINMSDIASEAFDHGVQLSLSITRNVFEAHRKAGSHEG